LAIQASVNVASYISSPETTEGTAVAADNQLPSTQLLVGPEVNVNPFRTNGSEYITSVQKGKEWSSVAIDGVLDFHDIVYLLSGHTKGGITPSASGTNGKVWAFTPDNTIDTFTIDYGDSVEAERAAGVFFDTLAINITRDSSTVSGSGIGRILTYAATLEVSPTLLTKQVVDPSAWMVKLADSQAALAGASESCAVYEANFSVSGRWGTRWPLCSTNTSYAGRVKAVPTLELGFSITNEAAGRALITTNLRGNTGKYVRLENTGAVIAGAMASAYKIVIEFFGFVTAAPKPTDFENLVVLPITLTGAKASDLTGYSVTVTNTLAAL
jgi:hypothetical protein